jgi:hypothetical protein
MGLTSSKKATAAVSTVAHKCRRGLHLPSQGQPLSRCACTGKGSRPRLHHTDFYRGVVEVDSGGKAVITTLCLTSC